MGRIYVCAKREVFQLKSSNIQTQTRCTLARCTCDRFWAETSGRQRTTTTTTIVMAATTMLTSTLSTFENLCWTLPTKYFRMFFFSVQFRWVDDGKRRTKQSHSNLHTGVSDDMVWRRHSAAALNMNKCLFIVRWFVVFLLVLVRFSKFSSRIFCVCWERKRRDH